MDNKLSEIIKKSDLGYGPSSFLECRRAAILIRALRIFLPSEGTIYVNSFDGGELIRAGKLTRRYELQYTVVQRLSGGPGYEIDLSALHRALS